MRISRRAAMALACGSRAVSAYAQRGPGNAEFQRYPFERWAAEGAKPQIRWNVRVGPAVLSPHQRFVTQVHVTVDSAEIGKRRDGERLIMFLRIEDSAGRRYQTSSDATVPRLRSGEKAHELDYFVSAFLLPGDYTVSLAVCDAKTEAHSFVRQRLHVAESRPDPLPEGGKGLPTVEFIPLAGTPESWYLPQMRSRLHLPVKTRRPVRVEILVNTTPSDLASINLFRVNMQLIVPSIKVLSGIEPSEGSVGLSIADLNRRAMTYEQPDLRNVDWGRGGRIRGDWAKMRPAFAELSTATVDAKTLAGQRKMLDYFAGEATRLLGPAGEPDGMARVLIVLSSPVFFTGQERPPLPDVPGDRDHRVFYLCYTPMAHLSGASGQVLGQRPLYTFTDDLEHLLKPMGGHTFRIAKPEEFRKALGAILDEIAGM